MWHFACTPFIFSRSANSCVWFHETNMVFLALLVLSVVFNKALERSDVAPYQGSHFFLRRQHSGAHIAHESFKMLTMWIISWIKVTDHVRSGKLRATVFTVIIRGIRKNKLLQSTFMRKNCPFAERTGCWNGLTGLCSGSWLFQIREAFLKSQLSTRAHPAATRLRWNALWDS